MNNLLIGETIQTQLSIANDMIILTDKRLLFNEHFIGLNELRSAKVEKKEVRVPKSKVKLGNVWFILGMLITLAFAINYGVNKHGSNLFGDIMAGMVLFALVGAGISGIIVAIISSILKSTAKILELSEIAITTTNNGFFIKHTYGIERYEELNQLCLNINNLVYK